MSRAESPAQSRIPAETDALLERPLELEHLSLRELERLVNGFDENGMEKTSYGSFRNLLVRSVAHDTAARVPEEQLRRIYDQMDIQGTDRLGWDEFTTNILLRVEAQREADAASATALFDSSRSPETLRTPHAQPIRGCRAIGTTGRFLTFSPDGLVCLWTDTFRVQRTLCNLSAAQKAGQRHSVYAARAAGQTPWTLDVVFMPEANKFACASDNFMVNLFDNKTLERSAVINLHDRAATCLDYYSERGRCCLCIGTDQGDVGVFSFDPHVLLAAPKAFVADKDLPEISPRTAPSGRYHMENTHARAVEGLVFHQMADHPPILISCSLDPVASLALSVPGAENSARTRVAAVHKGVLAFCVIPRTAIVVTGGLDHLVRIWSLVRFGTPVATLEGHTAPIANLVANPRNYSAVSLARDGQVRLWDAVNHVCLQSFSVAQPVSALAFLHNRLFACNTACALYSLNQPPRPRADASPAKRSAPVFAHQAPVCAVLYSSPFRQVVSVAENCDVCVWDVCTGVRSFRFRCGDAVGPSGIPVVATTAQLDSSQHRLAVGTSLGAVRVYNISNGQCLCELETGHVSEITAIVHVNMPDLKLWLVTGWDRRITSFADESVQTLRPLLSCPRPSAAALEAGVQAPVFHRDDILGLAFLAPNLTLSCSHDGLVCFGNVSNGEVLGVVRPNGTPVRQTSLVVLESAAFRRRGAHMITGGADGFVYFWNWIDGTLLFKLSATAPGVAPVAPKRSARTGSRPLVETAPETITALALAASDTLLVTGSEDGRVAAWDISKAAGNAAIVSTPTSMPCLASCAVTLDGSPVNSVAVVEIGDRLMIAAGGQDRRVVLLDIDGTRVGVFGQNARWDVNSHAIVDSMVEPVSRVQSPAAATRPRTHKPLDSPLPVELPPAASSSTEPPDRSELRTADYLSPDFYRTPFTQSLWSRTQRLERMQYGHHAVQARTPIQIASNDAARQRAATTQALLETVRTGGSLVPARKIPQDLLGIGQALPVYRDLAMMPLGPEMRLTTPNGLPSRRFRSEQPRAGPRATSHLSNASTTRH